MTLAAALASGIRALGLEIDGKAQAKLLAYIALLDKWNRVYNLTAIREPGRMVSHHLLDSLALLPYFPANEALRVLDIGSGGGLPGIPIAVARPEWRVTLLDRSRKKAAFLRQAQAELPLPNAEVVVARIEDYAPAAPFDVTMSRAFADVRALARSASRVTRPGGRCLAMKGAYPADEVADAPADFRVADVVRLEVPGIGAERHLVILERAP